MQRPKRKDRTVSGELCVLVDHINDSNTFRNLIEGGHQMKEKALVRAKP